MLSTPTIRLLPIAMLALLGSVALSPEAAGQRAPRRVEGFTFLGWKTYRCANDVEGTKAYRVAVYRCNAFYEAIKSQLKPGAFEADTQFVLLPPNGKSTTTRLGASQEELDSLRDPDCEFDIVDQVQADRERTYTARVSRFLIARTELTERIHFALRGSNNKTQRTSLTPIARVTWHQAKKFGWRFRLRLPKSHEWEYACRSGTRTPFCFGSKLTFRDANIWDEPVRPAAKGQSVRNQKDDQPARPSVKTKAQPVKRSTLRAVGSYKPNAYGLYDMHGNVAEWTATRFPSVYERGVRGGHFGEGWRDCRSASRWGLKADASDFYIGVRLVKSP